MIHLLTEDEIVTLTFGRDGDQTTFDVRKIHGGHLADIDRRSTVKGKSDPELREVLLADRVLTGWSGLLGKKGGPDVAYREEPTFKHRVLYALPIAVKRKIESAAFGDSAEMSEALGNSEPS